MLSPIHDRDVVFYVWQGIAGCILQKNQIEEISFANGRVSRNLHTPGFVYSHGAIGRFA
jgi:hypothetical protein